MRVILVTRDSKDLWIHEYLYNYLQKLIPDIEIKIFCGEPDKRNFVPKKDVEYVFSNYETFLAENQMITDDEIIRLHGVQGCFVASSLYRSDRRYVYHLAYEKDLALEQVYLIEQAKRLIGTFKPDYLFMTGGGNLIRNVFFLVGQTLGVRCYRILNTTYLNPERQGVRYWFNANNYCRLSDNPADKFHYEETDICKHAQELLGSIQDVNYNLSQFARTTARRQRMSSGFKRITRDIVGAGAYQLFKVQRGYQAWSRLQSLKNFALSKGIITHPNSITKPFFLFPLNVPEDAQVVLRAPQFRDLLSICEQIANVLPYGYNLVIKEHPGHPGMLDYQRLKLVLDYHPNIYYVTGDVQLWDLLNDTSALITVNSTAAIEALVNDIPVITLGEAFYRGTGLTYDVEYLFELPQILTDVITDPKKDNRPELLFQTMTSLLRETVPVPGMVETADEDNKLRIIVEGIVAKMEQDL